MIWFLVGLFVGSTVGIGIYSALQGQKTESIVEAEVQRRLSMMEITDVAPGAKPKKESESTPYDGPVKDVTIEYADYQGDVTKRDIKIKNFFKYDANSNDLYINAFCNLRKEMRKFKIDRIQKLWVKNAEIKNPQKYFSDIYTGKFFATKKDVASLAAAAAED